MTRSPHVLATRTRRAAVVSVGAVLLAGLVSVGPARAANTCSVAVTGVAAVGETLTAETTDNGAGFPTTFSWERSANSNMSASATAAMSASYVPSEADLCKYLQYTIAYTTSSASFYSCSSAILRVIRVAVPVPTAPSVVGKAKKKKTVTASLGSLPAGTSTSYQWFRIVKKRHKTVQKPIPGATAATYKLRGKDVRKKVVVQVTYNLAGHLPTVLRSAPRKVR